MSFHENLTDVEITELIQEMDKMFSAEGYEKTYQWAVNIIKDYPNCNMLIWQVAVMLDSRRIIGQCEHPDKYDEQINSWYEMALNDKDEKIQHHAADSLFGFYLRKGNYEMAEKYLNYLAFGMMITKALDNKDHKSARFLAEKMYALAGIFEMGKYNECATMFNVVVAEQNVEDTFKVIKQLLENVDTICDFQKSRLYKHIKFQDVENPYAEEMKKELIAGFQNEEDFAYMKGYKPWKKLLAKY